ncbi:hypothetical protein JCGZ_19166 [Jatropha curcas]|uniref:Uncharacterized protein n=1 Tax=Jatropha curcas TaxID=180498 RepID=A0A067LJ70_JATCU|nr:hypothetical protein JCGZ_19166 [Jatropha curcas]
MSDSSILISEIKKLIEKIVAANLEKLLWSDKGKDHVVIEDDEAKEEFKKKEQVDDTWQDKKFFAKKIFADVIDVLVVEPKGQELEKKEKKEKKETEEGIEGSKVAEEEDKKEEQAIQEEERDDKRATADEEVEDPTDQVLKAIWACIEESLEEVESPSDVFITCNLGL